MFIGNFLQMYEKEKGTTIILNDSHSFDIKVVMCVVITFLKLFAICKNGKQSIAGFHLTIVILHIAWIANCKYIGDDGLQY